MSAELKQVHNLSIHLSSSLLPTPRAVLGCAVLCPGCDCVAAAQVPIEVMNSMTRVPAAYLKQLAEERDIFNELPAAVKQQVRQARASLFPPSPLCQQQTHRGTDTHTPRSVFLCWQPPFFPPLGPADKQGHRHTH